jgi:hypothetical protein
MMKIGVADTAEKDFDLNIMICCIAPVNFGKGKRRRLARSRICFGRVQGLSPVLSFRLKMPPGHGLTGCS